MPETYIKDDKTVLLDNCNRFVYEVFVEASYENITCMVQHEYFSSDTEIKGVVESYKYSPYITIFCILLSAPKSWLEENDYSIYIKPVKKKPIKKKINEQNNKIN
jgi:hypothetical protein